MLYFLYQHELVNISKEPTCYKNSENSSCIDFILSNRPKRFLKTNVFTGLLDFHKLVLSVFKTTFPKSKPKEIAHRNFKRFSKENITKNLGQILGKDVLKIMHLLKTFSYIL